ncbi:MAG: GAF domain-containing protein [Planctomycetota bacterium]
MRALADALWDAFHTRADGDAGYSWVGFYFGPGLSFDDARAGDDEMILGPRRDKPACSPIGLHGACGRSFLEQRALVVTDVKHLGESYVACDPRDQSEVVVPLFDEDGTCFAVLDVDAFDVGAFTEHDATELIALLQRTGLTGSSPRAPTLVI